MDELEIKSSKGVFTKYILEKLQIEKNKMYRIYQNIITNILANQLNFSIVKSSVDKYLCESIIKSKFNMIYLKLDLGELFDKNLWVFDMNNNIIDFNLKRYNIRTDSQQTKLFEEYFTNCPIIKNYIDNYIKYWFDGCEIGTPHCRWYEPSDNLELWISISF